jgi:hypothetical protein
MKKTRLISGLYVAVFALAVGSAARADDAKCQDAVAKGSRNVGNQQQKKNRKCVKDGSGNIDLCVFLVDAKAEEKAFKLRELFYTGGKCDPAPAFGVNDGGAPGFPGDDVADGTIDAAGDILRKVFGDPVDGIVAGDKCQDAVAKRAGKAFDSGLKGFRDCMKPGVANQSAVDACVASGTTDQKLVRFIAKLFTDMGKKCDALPPAGFDDGDCSNCTDVATCSECVGNEVKCQVCLAANHSANGTANCDLLDDGGVNDSCGSEVVGGFSWFLGAPNESCDATCAQQGRTCSSATATYVGSGGTLAQCAAVVKAFYPQITSPGFEAAVILGFADSGCFLYSDFGTPTSGDPLRVFGAPTTCSALPPSTLGPSPDQYRRVCACV